MELPRVKQKIPGRGSNFQEGINMARSGAGVGAVPRNLK